MIYLQLFWVYLKIGLFSFGGGYAMLSFVEYEVVRHHAWIKSAEFADIVAISQMTPGPIGLNTATYVGYTVTGSVLGSAVATLAVCLPSFVLMILICRFLDRYRSNRWVEAALSGLKPVTVGLIAAAALTMTNRSTFFDFSSILIFLVAVYFSWRLNFHPILVLVLAGVAGWLIY
jgi:chromate transporter